MYVDHTNNTYNCRTFEPQNNNCRYLKNVCDKYLNCRDVSGRREYQYDALTDFLKCEQSRSIRTFNKKQCNVKVFRKSFGINVCRERDFLLTKIIVFRRRERPFWYCFLVDVVDIIFSSSLYRPPYLSMCIMRPPRY